MFWWVEPILCPAWRVVQDVLANRIEFALVSNHAFVVASLPDRRAGRPANLVHAPGDS